MKSIKQFVGAMSHIQRAAALIISCILLLSVIGASYGAYVSRSYVKGVAASPKHAMNMSSDLLGVVSKSASSVNYPVNRIVLDTKSDTDDSPYIISFYIDNTNGSTVSTKRTEYYINISGLPDGVTIKVNGTEITGTDLDNITAAGSELKYKAAAMPAYTKTTHTYLIEIPKNKIDSVTDITVIAVPTAESDAGGNMLAAHIQPSTVGSVATFSYQGDFSDRTSSNHPYDFAAFNYEVSVTGATRDHTMLLTWDPEKLEIDPDFAESISGSVSNTGSLEITMNGENNHYLIKFFRLIGRNENDDWQMSWEKMAGVITFSEKEN